MRAEVMFSFPYAQQHLASSLRPAVRLFAWCALTRLLVCPALVSLACAISGHSPVTGAAAAAAFGLCFVHRDAILIANKFRWFG